MVISKMFLIIHLAVLLINFVIQVQSSHGLKYCQIADFNSYKRGEKLDVKLILNKTCIDKQTPFFKLKSGHRRKEDCIIEVKDVFDKHEDFFLNSTLVKIDLEINSTTKLHCELKLKDVQVFPPNENWKKCNGVENPGFFKKLWSKLKYFFNSNHEEYELPFSCENLSQNPEECDENEPDNCTTRYNNTAEHNNVTRDSDRKNINAGTNDTASENNPVLNNNTTEPNSKIESNSTVKNTTTNEIKEQAGQQLQKATLTYVAYGIGVVVAVCVVTLLVCLFVRKYRNVPDPPQSMELNNYSLADTVLYADLEITRGVNTNRLHVDELPYAEVIGVLSPEKNVI